MRGLNTLVIVMSVLLVAGFGLLIYGIASKFRTTEQTAEAPASAQAAFAAQKPLIEDFEGVKTLALPAASNIIDMASYDRGIILRISQFGGEQIIFVNLSKGSIDATLKIDRQRTPGTSEEDFRRNAAQNPAQIMEEMQKRRLENYERQRQMLLQERGAAPQAQQPAPQRNAPPR